MPLKEQFNADLKTAMKEKAQTRLTTIRQIRATVTNREIELHKELDEAEVVQVITTLVKQHKDSIEQFAKGGRADLVAKEEAELRVLEAYLPKQLSEAELCVVVQEAIRALNATSIKEMGAVMKSVMSQVQGQADGKLINQLVKQFLA